MTERFISATGSGFVGAPHLPRLEVMVGGGAAYFIRPELEHFFDQRGIAQQITWAEALRQEMTDVLRGQDGTAEPELITSVRWANFYGLFKTFMYSAKPTQTC